ncbi:MAG: hypothetical protein AAGA08_06990 [Pseudomonadota bacterium]
MSAAQSEEVDQGSPFSGSPYLNELALRMEKSASPTHLSMEELRAFLSDALGDAKNGTAGRAMSDALEYYSQLADFYGYVFNDRTITPAAGKAVALPKLDPRDVEVLPDQPVVLSVLDEGVPFLHERTITHTGRSRFVSTWLQDAAGTKGQLVQLPFGKAVDHEEIQRLIRSGVGKDVAYRSCGAIDRSMGGSQRYSERSTHGAAILGLAAGQKTDNHLLMGVSFPPNAVRDTSGSLLPFFVLLGICFCLKRVQLLAEQLGKADAKRFKDINVPLVFNLSYGVLAGPKDGSGMLERVMDALSSLAPGDIKGVGQIRFVLPMGNGRLSQTSATLGGTKDRRVALRLAPDDRTPSYVEIWSSKSRKSKPSKPGLFVELSPPQSEDVKLVPVPAFGHYTDMTFACGAHLRVYSVLRKSAAGFREMLLLAFPSTTGDDRSDVIRPGDWTVELTAATKDAVQVYVQRDDGLHGLSSGGQQSRMHHPDYELRTAQGRLVRTDTPGSSCPVTRDGTVNAFANAASILRIGGTMGQSETTASYSALGVTDDVRDSEGDVLAPSDLSRLTPGILTAGLSSCSYFRVSGTSIAVPQVALAEVRKLSS